MGEIWATCTRNELREDIDSGWWLRCQESPLKTLLSEIRIEDFIVRIPIEDFVVSNPQTENQFGSGLLTDRCCMVCNF